MTGLRGLGFDGTKYSAYCQVKVAGGALHDITIEGKQNKPQGEVK